MVYDIFSAVKFSVHFELGLKTKNIAGDPSAISTIDPGFFLEMNATASLAGADFEMQLMAKFNPQGGLVGFAAAPLAQLATAGLRVMANATVPAIGR